MSSQLQFRFRLYSQEQPPRPSAKLREARDILRRLLLAESALLEDVADRADAMASRLDELAVKQEMWETACQRV
jgi:hypothetical protein